MSKSCKGRGGSIINVSSVLGLEPYSGCPIFTTTQQAIVALTRSLGYGYHYEHTWVKVMALCPGFTTSELFNDVDKKCLHNKFSRELQKELEFESFQDPCYVARGLIKILQRGKSASVWLVEDEKEAVPVDIPALDNLLKKC